MKDKLYNPASTNQQAPAEGMAAVNTFNSEETENSEKTEGGMPKNIDSEKKREQEDDTHPVRKER